MVKSKIYIFVVPILAFLSCRPTPENKFERAAAEKTRKCPQVIDEYTRLDSVVYLPGANTNQYFYTLSGDAAANTTIFAANKLQMEEILKNEVANSLELKEYKDFQTTLEYIYRSGITGEELLRIRITPDMYR